MDVLVEATMFCNCGLKVLMQSCLCHEMGLKWDPKYGCVYNCVVEMGFEINDAFMIVFV